MPDTPLTDPRDLDKLPRLWAELLQSSVRGHALWDAAPLSVGGAVGDCGYIDGGKFVKLFNIFDDNPLGISPEMYDLKRDDIEVNCKPNAFPLHFSSNVLSLDLGFDLRSGPLMITSPIQASLTASIRTETDKAAFLAFCGPTCTDVSYQRTILLQSYIAEHHVAIVKYYGRQYPVEVGNLVIVHRATTAASWLAGVSTQREVHIGAEASLNGVGPRMGFTTSHTQGWLTNHGSLSWEGQDLRDDCCLVVRLIKIRMRDRLRTTLRTVGDSFASRPRQFPFNSKVAQGDGSRGPGSSEAGSLQTTERAGTPRQLDSLPETVHTDVDGNDEPIISFQPDLLDSVLDFILLTVWSAEGAVGDWDVLARFLEVHGEFPEHWAERRLIRAEVELRSSQAGFEIAHLVSLSRNTIPLEPTLPRALAPADPLLGQLRGQCGPRTVPAYASRNALVQDAVPPPPSNRPNDYESIGQRGISSVPILMYCSPRGVFTGGHSGSNHVYNRQAALENRVRTHTGHRPFKCAYCGAEFITLSNKTRHERAQHDQSQ